MGDASKIVVEFRVPPLRANGLPGKRASVERCAAGVPASTTVHSNWMWRGCPVRLYCQPVLDTHHFDRDTSTPFFLGSFLPVKFHTSQLVWGDTVWFEFHTRDLPKQLGDFDAWFHKFLQTDPITHVCT